jgi:predicted dehydrogenase
MAPSREQELAMTECARANGVFLAEAFWTRMFPATRQAAAWIREGKIGDVVAVNGTFSFIGDMKKGDRLYEPSAAGGTLLDIGVYLLQEADLMFGGPPEEVAALSSLGSFGTDDGACIALKYGGGVATLLTSFKTNGRDTFTVYGTEGVIEIFEDFWRPHRIRLTNGAGVIDFGTDSDFTGEGYQFEIRHIHECLEKGLKESPLITHRQSLDIITTCDRIRKQWGLKFPFEE